MPIVYLLLTAAAYGFVCASYDIYQILRFEVSGARPDFLPPQEGAAVRVPKTPLPSGGAVEAEVELDSSAASQIP